MSQGRHGIKVLGLSLLAALGLMAFAASAQATGEFTINTGVGGTHKTFTVHGIASETVSGTVAAGKLLVPAQPLTITCASGAFSGTVLLGGVAHVIVLYSGCESTSVCKPFETKAKMETNLTADKGFIEAPGLGELVLMGGKHYLLVTVDFNIYWPKLCSLPLESLISGSTVFELPTALTLGVVNQTLSTIPQATLESLFPSDKLTYGTNPAWLDEGEATAALSGALKGKFWGAE